MIQLLATGVPSFRKAMQCCASGRTFDCDVNASSFVCDIHAAPVLVVGDQLAAAVDPLVLGPQRPVATQPRPKIICGTAELRGDLDIRVVIGETSNAGCTPSAAASANTSASEIRWV